MLICLPVQQQLVNGKYHINKPKADKLTSDFQNKVGKERSKVKEITGNLKGTLFRSLKTSDVTFENEPVQRACSFK